MSNAIPVDADNGRSAGYSLHLCTSDVLGLMLALRRHGYVIRRSWWPF